MKNLLLRILSSLCIGVVAALLMAVSAAAAMLHFFPGEPDDAGFSGVAAFGIFCMVGYVGVPLIFAIAYFILHKIARKNEGNRS